LSNFNIWSSNLSYQWKHKLIHIQTTKPSMMPWCVDHFGHRSDAVSLEEMLGAFQPPVRVAIRHATRAKMGVV
jgi:hypothetical protein